MRRDIASLCAASLFDSAFMNGEEPEMADKDCIDPKGYWVCPEGGIRHKGAEDGEQEVIVKKTDAPLDMC